MKANELRIGNLVFRKSDMFMSEVHSVWPTSVKLWCNPLALFNETEVEPIPLSEEILLKVGFEKDEDGWLYISYKQQDHTESYGIKLNGDYWEFYMFDLTRLKHLHQLQNLIFSLTGQELNTSVL